LIASTLSRTADHADQVLRGRPLAPDTGRHRRQRERRLDRAPWQPGLPSDRQARGRRLQIRPLGRFDPDAVASREGRPGPSL